MGVSRIKTGSMCRLLGAPGPVFHVKPIVQSVVGTAEQKHYAERQQLVSSTDPRNPQSTDVDIHILIHRVIHLGFAAQCWVQGGWIGKDLQACDRIRTVVTASATTDWSVNPSVRCHSTALRYVGILAAYGRIVRNQADDFRQQRRCRDNRDNREMT